MQELDKFFNNTAMTRSCFILLSFLLVACNDDEQVAEKNRIIREQFDSINRKTDSFNRKVQHELDSAIQNIDSLLMEVQKKKDKK